MLAWNPETGEFRSGQAPATAYRAALAVLLALQLPGLVGFVLRRRRETVAARAAAETALAAPL